jgi:hypothetical protein
MPATEVLRNIALNELASRGRYAVAGMARSYMNRSL